LIHLHLIFLSVCKFQPGPFIVDHMHLHPAVAVFPLQQWDHCVPHHINLLLTPFMTTTLSIYPFWTTSIWHSRPFLWTTNNPPFLLCFLKTLFFPFMRNHRDDFFPLGMRDSHPGVQHPNLSMIWLHTECPHAGITGSRLTHKRCASQCIGPVAASPTLHTWWRRSLRIASKTKRLCRMTAAYFTLPMTPRRRFVLDGATRAIVVTKSSPRGQHSMQLTHQFFT